MASEMRFLNHDVMQKKISAGLQMRINLDNANAVIRFTHSEMIGLGWIESPAPMIYGEPTVVADRGIQVLLSDVKLLSERRRYTEMLAEELSSFGVEEHRQAAIIEDIFREVEVAVPGFQIIVFLRSVRETPCNICEEGLCAVKEDEAMMMITRLPCSHWYHGDCIKLWLERNHFCPLCRYAMPVVEEPSRRLHWPRLIMSAAALIIGLLLYFAD